MPVMIEVAVKEADRSASSGSVPCIRTSQAANRSDAPASTARYQRTCTSRQSSPGRPRSACR